MPIELRPYQIAAIESTWNSLKRLPGSPVIVAPTGSGKSLLLSQLAVDAVRQWDARVLIMAHRKELLEQNSSELQALFPDTRVGIYSAGLSERDTESQIICAGIQSVYKRAFEFGERHLLLIDEVHLVPEDGEGMYQQFLADMRMSNPKFRMVGLTATPYRMRTGDICGPDKMFQYVSYEARVQELIDDGYLCPIVNRISDQQIDTSSISIRGGEFVQREMEDTFNGGDTAVIACREIIAKCADRKSILVFCSGVAHAENVAGILRHMTGEDVGLVVGDTLSIVRSSTLEAFKDGRLRWLINVEVLTTGFNAKCIDAIAVLRCTQSPGLFAQIVGRGFRVHPSKQNTLLLDFGGNLKRHGPLDDPAYGRKSSGSQWDIDQDESDAPQKVCPKCQEDVHAAVRFCPYCGEMFPEGGITHDDTSDDESAVMAKDKKNKRYTVLETHMSRHVKRKNTEGKPDTLRVDYLVVAEGIDPENHGNLDEESKSEWICFEHPQSNYAYKKADQWWRARSLAPTPESIDEAIALWSRGAVAPTLSIEWDTSESFARPINHEVAERPKTWQESVSDTWSPSEGHWDDDEEIPF